ncbi:hypothetical protein P4C99_21785 [Pontiellaceae bacterium B1224]|nr:hypothetical protein [Pontiellaceae bacterium B1224]
MRDYLYIFNNPKDKFILASGIEFKVIAEHISDRGLFLLKHEYPNAGFDFQSRFEYLSSVDIAELSEENIYGWGDFCWVDFIGNPPFQLDKNTISELLYFAHASEPLQSFIFDQLQNKFLCYIHDDGWYLKLYYNNWDHVDEILKGVVPRLGGDSNLIRDIEIGDEAYWISNGVSEICDKTTDIDSILNKKLN